MQLNQFVPENLDLDTLLMENPPEFKYHKDYFIHIINLITEIPANNKDLLNEENFTPINAQKLQSRIKEGKKYLDYLVKYGVLETDNHYIVKEKSKGYKFTKPYQKRLKVLPINKYTLIRTISKKNNFDYGMEKKYDYLAKWFNNDLTIDFDGACDYLYEDLKNNTDKGVKNSALKFNAGYMNTYKLSRQDYLFKVDANVNRLHTNLTCIKSELRNFISYNGTPLVSVDLKNSQPCFSTALLNEDFYKKGQNLQKKGNFSFTLQNIHPIYYSNITSPPLVMLEESSRRLENTDITSYIQETSKGTLYEHIQEELVTKTGQLIDDRKALKAVIFTVLFTDNRFIGQKDAEPKRIFKQVFPIVYEVFSRIKKGDPTRLPILLQKMESRLMLDHIAKRISKEISGVPLYTIHDSIVCPVGYEHQVDLIIKEEMQKAIGITPTTTFDYWTPGNLKKE